MSDELKANVEAVRSAYKFELDEWAQFGGIGGIIARVVARRITEESGSKPKIEYKCTMNEEWWGEDLAKKVKVSVEEQ